MAKDLYGIDDEVYLLSKEPNYINYDADTFFPFLGFIIYFRTYIHNTDIKILYTEYVNSLNQRTYLVRNGNWYRFNCLLNL